MYIWLGKTDKQHVLESGEFFRPVATLTDKYGGRAQILIDDGCYVLALKQENGEYKYTPYWFREAVAVLQNLPSEPKKARLLPFMEWLMSDGFEEDLKEAEQEDIGK